MAIPRVSSREIVTNTKPLDHGIARRRLTLHVSFVRGRGTNREWVPTVLHDELNNYNSCDNNNSVLAGKGREKKEEKREMGVARGLRTAFKAVAPVTSTLLFSLCPIRSNRCQLIISVILCEGTLHDRQVRSRASLIMLYVPIFIRVGNERKVLAGSTSRDTWLRWNDP